MITNPVGIDRPIQEMQQLFIANLWTGFNCQFNHRVFGNYNEKKLIPFILVDGTDRYVEVLFNDRVDALGWFDVSDRTKSIDGTQVSQDVGIFFAVNLKKVYPLLAHRAVEEAHKDALMQIKKRPIKFEILGLETGEAAYGDFDTDNLIKYNMQPWHVFRYNCNVKYSFNC